MNARTEKLQNCSRRLKLGGGEGEERGLIAKKAKRDAKEMDGGKRDMRAERTKEGGGG